MVAFWSLLLPLISLAGLINAKSSFGDSVLIVLEPNLQKEDYSIFFTSLTGVHADFRYSIYANEDVERGYDLTFRAPMDLTPLIIEDDIPSFAHVVLFAPDSKSAPTNLVEFSSPLNLCCQVMHLILHLSP
jgi:oligosaccharyltransferase complex subunit beta